MLTLVRDEMADVPVDLMTAEEVAALLRIGRKKVYELAIPRFALSERRVRWMRSDVLAYVRRCRQAA